MTQSELDSLCNYPCIFVEYEGTDNVYEIYRVDKVKRMLRVHLIDGPPVVLLDAFPNSCVWDSQMLGSDHVGQWVEVTYEDAAPFKHFNYEKHYKFIEPNYKDNYSGRWRMTWNRTQPKQKLKNISS